MVWCVLQRMPFMRLRVASVEQRSDHRASYGANGAHRYAQYARAMHTTFAADHVGPSRKECILLGECVCVCVCVLELHCCLRSGMLGSQSGPLQDTHDHCSATPINSLNKSVETIVALPPSSPTSFASRRRAVGFWCCLGVRADRLGPMGGSLRVCCARVGLAFLAAGVSSRFRRPCALPSSHAWRFSRPLLVSAALLG